MAEAHGPLHGVRVVDAATLAAGPLVATAMGEFGAEVIKVEQPGAGDPLRTWGDRKDEVGLVWKSMSRNKRCVTLDLRQADGQELFHRLLDVSDVLVMNNRPSAMARWGIDYESVHDRHPQLVMLHVSGYGRGGPQERPPRLRHPGRGHERVRPPDRPARRAAHPAAVHAGRRGGRPGGDVRGDDGPLPPGRARRRRPARRRQSHRAAGPPHRVRPPWPTTSWGSSPAASATASTPAHRATPIGPPTTNGWPSPAHHRTSPHGSTGPSTAPTWPTTRTTSTPSPASSGPARSTSWWPSGSAAAPWPRPWPPSRTPRWPPHPSTTPSSCWPTRTCGPGGPSCGSTTPTSAP